MRWTGLAPAMVAMGVAAVSPAAVPATPQQQIESAMLDSAAGWNAGDLNRFVAIYAPEATYVTPAGLIRGRPAIADHYAASFTDGGNRRGTLAFRFLYMRGLDPQHVLLFARWQLTPPGLSKGDGGMTTLVFERQADGWKIIADHSS